MLSSLTTICKEEPRYLLRGIIGQGPIDPVVLIVVHVPNNLRNTFIYSYE